MLDADFIARACTDPAAFTQLYERYYDGVFRYCVHRLFNRAIAEDITSVVFLKVVENLHRFRGDQQAFKYWLYRIATNTIHSHVRRCRSEKQVLQDLAEKVENGQPAGVDAAVEQKEKMVVLQQAIRKLKPQYQAIITLHYFENMKLTDIAGILKCSNGTVRSRCKRAREKLQKHMAIAMKHASSEVK